MSRLTASPFHKPSPFSFPRAPLSPPDTTVDAQAVPSVLGGHPVLDTDVSPIHNTESPGARFRRVSSLAYHTSGLSRDRDRISHRNYKSFIVVIPPPSFLQEHGQLGHTLSFGPIHRLSQGLLMPLFPTMYAQLNAIAREFNFPSTSGICLYLQHTENGITVTPRISDESWQMIWSHVFEAATPSSPGPPICGKVEFDIDRRHARWYPSWIASSHQADHQLDMPMSLVPSTAPSLAHFRDESRGTYEDDQNDEQIYAPRSAPATRHVPKKLSLVDRLETLSIRSGTHSQRPPMMTPPDNIPSTTQTLSPIFQEDEPQTAKLYLEEKVESWRASAKLAPTPLAAKGQTSLEPANMPNSISLDISSSPEADDELNLEDFTWSISSAGPSDYDPESPLAWDYRVPSVHLANRLEGSVCLTPSVCTSFGPSDYTLSPLSETGDYRPFTPDLARRMYDNLPPTPTTATSWGPPSVALSPTQSEYAYSIDLGQRGVFSPPPTPTTATSWGPPSWPASPTTISRPPSVHLGDRGLYSLPVTPLRATMWGAPLSPAPWQFVWPYTNQMQPSSPWQFVWPYTNRTQPSSPWQFVWPYTNRTQPSSPWQFVWPYTNRTQPSSPWQFVWPYRNSHQPIEADSRFGSYPYLNIYSAAYPHFDLYPAIPGSIQHSSHSDYTYLREFASVYEHFNDRYSAATTSSYIAPLLASTPFLKGFASVYPYFSGTTTTPSLPRETRGAVIVHTTEYPFFILYPPQYPHFDLYPPLPDAANESISRPLVPVKLDAQYPMFNIYPAIYPWNLDEIYPLCRLECSPSVQANTSAPYPCFDLYPAIYPYVTPYPSVEFALQNTSVATSRSGFSIATVSISHPSIYPAFNLYPPVYPEFELYPAIETRATHEAASVQPPPVYPAFSLYPAVYPHFDIYPAFPEVEGSSMTVRPTAPSAIVFAEGLCLVDVENQYPFFDIYSAVYPALNIYPSLPEDMLNRRDDSVLDLYPTTVLYPIFNIYPVVYPRDPELVPADYTKSYPFFNFYPAVYPHFDLYSAGKFVSEQDETVIGNARYPYFQIYPGVYPCFDMYPSIQPAALARLRKTHQELHEEVFQQRFQARKSHHELHFAVFKNGIVSTPSGTFVPPVPPCQTLPSARPRSGSVARPVNSLRTSRVVTVVPSIVETDSKMTTSAHRFSPIKERPMTLNRSNSATPVRPVPEKPLDRSHSASVRAKRDSLVLQRVKAFNTASDDTEAHRQIGQPGPKLVRSRYPFA